MATPSTWAQLGKLRGISWRELRVRGAQELAKWSERHLGSGARELTDEQLLHALAPAARRQPAEAAAATLLERLRQPQQQRFFSSLAQRAEVAALLETRFPVERSNLLARADRVLANRFDIFEHAGLRFGEPVDWQLEPVSGKRTPLLHWSELDFLDPAVAGDKKFTWELNRHQFFVTLGQAYWLTGEERYAAKFVALATAWLDANPPKRGINWASSLELALRVIAWLWALHLFAEAKALTPEFVTRLLKSLIAQGQHIETYLSHYFSPNTHLTGEALALFYLGTALPELQRAGHWRQTGLQILLEQLPKQVRTDGVYFEQSSYYHRYTADFYTHLWLLGRAHGIELPRVVEAKLKALHEHLLWITRPDGGATFYGDDDGGRLLMLSTRQADDFRDTLATGAALFQRGDWKSVAGGAAIETLWLLGPQGLRDFDELVARAPAAQTKAFAESGFYVLRDGWERTASYLFIDCGLHGAMNAGHAHSDALAFEFAAGGVTWLVDPGTFSYTGDLPLRNEIRCSQSHTTVSVDGASQSEPQTAFTWRNRASAFARELHETEAGVFFAGQQNGYTRLPDPVRQQRAWFLRKAQSGALPCLLVRDRLEAKGAHRYQWFFHFAAGCHALVDDQLVRVSAARQGKLILTARVREQAPSHPLQFAVAAGWVSRCYGQREPAPVVTIAAEASGAFALEILLLPVPPAAEESCERLVTQWLNGNVAIVAGEGPALESW